MNRFKRSCFSLCLAFMFCVGFLLTDSITAYAYELEDNFYPIVEPASFFQVYIDDVSGSSKYTCTVDGNKMIFNNPYLENVNRIDWFSNFQTYEFTFPYNPDVYDYYLLGSVTAANPTTGSNASNFEKSTFKPSYLKLYYRNYETEGNSNHAINGYNIYNIDSTTHAGFGFYVEVDFEYANNIGFHALSFLNDIQGSGNKPANLTMELGILAVEKTESDAGALSQILGQLVKMESTLSSTINGVADEITGAISDSTQQITDSIENQYDMSDNEDFGVDDIQQNIEEKMGVLNFGADTLTNFLDLFSAENATNTVITFPAFSINIQGTDYTIWNNIDFNLSFLEDNFGVLVTAVRTVTVLCVWLAVLGYLVKAKDIIFSNE